MRPRAGIIAALLPLLLGAAGPLRGEPYLAVRTGLKCSACHVNRTGGGKRTDFGAIYTMTHRAALPLSSHGGGRFLSGHLNDFISTGANLRLAESSFFRPGRPNDSGFNITEANLYVQADLVEGLVTLYLDETVAPAGARSREAFALVEIPRWALTVKAGRFLLPYGYRLLDDLSFIRQSTGFTYANQDLGVEVGLEAGPFDYHVAFTNGTGGGTETNLDKEISMIGSAVYRHLRLGGSLSTSETADVRTTIVGGFAGMNWGRLTLLGEIDAIRTAERKAGPDQFGAFAECDLLVARGVNLKLAYDYLDRDVDVPENARDRITAGVEVFLTPYTQARLLLRRNDDIPQLTTNRDDELLAEFHVFY